VKDKLRRAGKAFLFETGSNRTRDIGKPHPPVARIFYTPMGNNIR
jgi:hypothetical protein